MAKLGNEVVVFVQEAGGIEEMINKVTKKSRTIDRPKSTILLHHTWLKTPLQRACFYCAFLYSFYQCIFSLVLQDSFFVSPHYNKHTFSKFSILNTKKVPLRTHFDCFEKSVRVNGNISFFTLFHFF